MKVEQELTWPRVDVGEAGEGGHSRWRSQGVQSLAMTWYVQGPTNLPVIFESAVLGQVQGR